MFRYTLTWSKLQRATRATLLKLKTGDNANPKLFAADIDILLNGEILERHPSGGHVCVHQGARVFMRSMRAMSRHDVLSLPTFAAAEAYFREMFEPDDYETVAAFEFRKLGSQPTAELANMVGHKWRLRAFLDTQLDGPAANYPESLDEDAAGKARLKTIIDTAKEVIGELETQSPRAFLELGLRYDRQGRVQSFLSAVGMGTAIAVLFSGLAPDDLMPRIGIWPVQLEGKRPPIFASHSKHRVIPEADPLPKPAPKPAHTSHHGSPGSRDVIVTKPDGEYVIHFPAEVKPIATYPHIRLLDDMVALLRFANTAVLPIRASDGRLYAKEEKKLDALRHAAPDWFNCLYTLPPNLRTGRAISRCTAHDLAAMVQGEPVFLQVKPAGQQFLAKAPIERVKWLLDLFRKRCVREGRGSVPSTWFDPNMKRREVFPPWIIQSSIARDDDRICSGLMKALDDLPKDGSSVSLVHYLGWSAAKHNPIAQLIRSGSRWFSNTTSKFGRDDADSWDIEWQHHVRMFFSDSLLELGAISLGTTAAEPDPRNMTVAITPIGRYLLGEQSALASIPAAASAPGVLIQPNFDIVFLAPDYEAELLLAPFCERTGQGVGAVFKLTRQSVYAAVGSGQKPDDMLAALKSAAAKGVPENVEHELNSWGRACKRIDARRSLVLKCPDPHTAALVRKAAGKDGELLAECVVEFKSGKIASDVKKKLVNLGIFVGEIAGL